MGSLAPAVAVADRERLRRTRRASDVDLVIIRHLCHVDSMHLVTRLEPVAVALLIVCAVLAASRGWRPLARRPSTVLWAPWTRLRDDIPLGWRPGW